MPDNTQMPDDFGARRSPGSRVTMARSFAASRRSASILICVDLPDPSPPSKEINRPRAGNSFDRCLGHRQSFSAPARNIPITSSLAPSMARRIVDPVPTDSAA